MCISFVIERRMAHLNKLIPSPPLRGRDIREGVTRVKVHQTALHEGQGAADSVTDFQDEHHLISNQTQTYNI